VLTTSAVTEGDRIDGCVVMSAGPSPDLDGATLFYRLYLQ
jgi:hypothetical protein